MAHYNFNKDLVEGEEGEKFVIKYLEKYWGGKFLSDNKTNSHDVEIEFPSSTQIFEIKTDVYPKDTGNIFVEFESRGKDSGIVVTKADWFVTYFKHLKEIWFIETNKLRELINENNFYQTSKSGDEGSNTRGYLIRRKQYKDHFKVIKLK